MQISYLYFEITRRCNQRCLQCFNNSGRALQGELGTDEVSTVIKAFKRQGGRKIQITGGDPFARKDLDEILQVVRQCEFEHTILSTNGMRIDDPWLARHANVIKEIDISLDGFRSEHDFLRGVVSFDRTVNAIRASSAAGYYVFVCTCLTKTSLSYIDAFIEFLISLGVKHVRFSTIGDVGRKQVPIEVRIPKANLAHALSVLRAKELKYRGRLGMTIPLGTTPVIPSIEQDGLVCDPVGRLYPVIGFLPKGCAVGTAYPEWDINPSAIADYLGRAKSTIEAAIPRVLDGEPIYWWTLLHDAVAAAPLGKH